MAIVGKRTKGAAPVELATDTKRVARFAFPAPGLVPKLSVFLDGLGSGVGSSSVSALLRPLIYNPTGDVLVARGDELVLPGGSPAGWYDLTFTGLAGGAAAIAAAGNYDIGVHVGGPTNVARVWEDDPDSPGGRRNTDAYSDGAAATFGASTTLTGRFSIFTQPFAAFVAPNELEMWYGRLPFREGQSVFASTGALGTGSTTATCAWHGTKLDPERGSFVVVQTGGKFDAWVGERIKITSRDTGRNVSVYCYAHNAIDIADDLSVPRRVFSALTVLGRDRISVAAELMR